jgi:hypothetical protein
MLAVYHRAGAIPVVAAPWLWEEPDHGPHCWLQLSFVMLVAQNSGLVRKSKESHQSLTPMGLIVNDEALLASDVTRPI